MRRIFTTIALAMLTIAVAAAPALADAPDGPAHIALGDSVAAGSGANNPNTAYVPRLHRYLHSADCGEGVPAACPHLELIDLSVGGATSGDLIATQLGPALAEIQSRSGDGIPGNEVEYVTLTIGGNDLFRPVIEACTTGGDCAGTITGLFTTYGQNLGYILWSLRSAAPDAEIAIMTYYNPLGSCVLADLAPLADAVLEGDGAQLAFGLNDIIRDVAGNFDVTVVETYGVLGDKDFVGGEDCLHPDDSGHRKIAKAFIRAMK